jgi:hypothetical protein
LRSELTDLGVIVEDPDVPQVMIDATKVLVEAYF